MVHLIVIIACQNLFLLRHKYICKLLSHCYCSYTATDIFTILGVYLMIPSADFRQPVLGFNDIRDMAITETSRVICYNQIIYDDDRIEEDEFFSLSLTVQDRSPVGTQVHPQFSSTSLQSENGATH